MMVMAYPDAPGTPLSSSRQYAHSFALPIAQPHAQQRERQQPPPFEYPASHNQPFSSSSMPAYHSTTTYVTPHASSLSHSQTRPLSPVQMNRSVSHERTSWDVFEPSSSSGGHNAMPGYLPSRTFPSSFESVFEEQVNRAHELSSLPGMEDRKLKPLVPFPDSDPDLTRQWTFDGGSPTDAPQHPHYSQLPHAAHNQYAQTAYPASLAATQHFLPTGMTLSTRSDRVRSGYSQHTQPIMPVITSPDLLGWQDSTGNRFDVSPVQSSVSDTKDAGSPRSVHSASPSHHSDGKEDASGAALLPAKKKRKRASGKQLETLNMVYARTAFPTTEERHELARQLDMSPRSVQIWFQNRRQSQRERRPMGASPLAPNVDRIPKRELSAGRGLAAPYPMTLTTYPMHDLLEFQAGAAADPNMDARSVALDDTHPDNLRRGRPRRMRTP